MVRSIDQAQGHQRNEHLTDRADCKWPPALLAELAETGAQAYSCKGQQKRPAREVREAGQLWFGEVAERGEQRDEQESQHELREFFPEKSSFVADDLSLSARCPVDRIGEHDEADEGVAGGLGEDGDFAGGVGVERAGGGCFGGVVDGEAGPESVGFVAQMQRVADERKGEERDGAEGEDGGDGVGGVFIVGVDGGLGGDDGGDSADGGANGKQRGELGLEFEGCGRAGA